jgi:hypothetical protein
MFLKCKGCQRLEKENEYLKSLIKALMEAKGLGYVQDIEKKALYPDQDIQEEELPEGVEKYGN